MSHIVGSRRKPAACKVQIHNWQHKSDQTAKRNYTANKRPLETLQTSFYHLYLISQDSASHFNFRVVIVCPTINFSLHSLHHATLMTLLRFSVVKPAVSSTPFVADSLSAKHDPRRFSSQAQVVQRGRSS